MLFAGFRGDNVGADYNNYQARFLVIYDANLSTKFDLLLSGGSEPGYLLINYMFSWSSFGYLGVFFTFALLSVSINSYFIRRYSPYVGISFLIYFCHIYLHLEMIQIRGGLATAILLFSFRYLVTRELGKYLIVVALATSIHFFSVLALIPYFVFGKDLVFSKMAPVYLLMPCLVSLFIPFHELLIFLLGDISESLRLYAAWERYTFSLGYFNPVFLKQLVVLTMFYIFRDKFRSLRDPFLEGAIFFYCIATVWIFVFRDFAILGARGASFFSIADFILLPYLIDFFRQKKTIWLCIALYCLLILVLNVFFKIMIRDYYTIFRDLL